ncbi:MAG: carbohydrate kinase family protein [Lentisphaerae bacterium]|nr:carbohydrate kinase family protein [Lentisphaerota bacterium]
MTQTQCDAVVAGHICLDLIPRMLPLAKNDFQSAFVPGRLINVADAAISTGGPVSNTGIAMHKLGIQVALVGKVGKDFFGGAILELLKEYGADRTMAVVDDESTSYTVVIAPPGVDRIFLHNPGVNNTFAHSDVRFDIVEQARLFHLGYPPLMRELYSNDGRELIEIFRRAKETGVTTSLDMSLPDMSSESGSVAWDRVVESVIPYVDIYLPSVEETLFMLDKKRFLEKKAEAGGRDVLDFIPVEDVVKLGGTLLSHGAKIVVLKCGHRGIYVCTSESSRMENMGRAKPASLDGWNSRQLWEPACRVDHLASAAGSGDSAIAGFLSSFLKGEDLLTCMKYACMVGAHNVQQLDAVSGVKSWEDTTRDIAACTKRDPEINAPGWRHDEDARVWIGPADKGK